MKVTAVKLMQCISVRTKKGVGGLGGEDGEGAEVWVRLKQQKDCWSCFHTSRALVTGKLLCSALSAVLLTHVCVFLVHVCLSTGNENSCVAVP